MSPWHLNRMAAFDLETHSPNPHEARIVEAYLGYVGGGIPTVDALQILVDPGVEVPEEATEVHGYTTEHLRAHGQPAAAAVDQITSLLADALAGGTPLVGHNVGTYDLTVVEAECRRHNLPTLSERTGGRIGPVIDTKVLSKHVDPWRRRVSKDQGAHVLKTCAQVFNVGWNDADAHGARYDALISARVAWRMGVVAHLPRRDRPRIQSGRRDDRHLFDALAVDLPVLHASQKRWAAEQAASYQDYLRSEKAGADRDPGAVINGEWPIQFAPAARQEALTP